MAWETRGSGLHTNYSISGLVVEYIVAIDVTRVRFPADAFYTFLLSMRSNSQATFLAAATPFSLSEKTHSIEFSGSTETTNDLDRETSRQAYGAARSVDEHCDDRNRHLWDSNPRGETPSA